MTIALILLSWLFSFQRIGVIVLYVHDVSDITIDLLKMFNYLKWEVRPRLGALLLVPRHALTPARGRARRTCTGWRLSLSST